MKWFELLELPEDELRHRLQNAKLELSNLRFRKATHQIENPLKIRETRKEIARIKTLVSEYGKKLRIPKKVT